MVWSSMIRTAPNTITLEPEDSLRRGCSNLARLWLLDGAAMLYQSPASVNRQLSFEVESKKESSVPADEFLCKP